MGAAVCRGGPGYRRYRFETAALGELNAVLASYPGHFKRADSYNLLRSLWREFSFLGEYFSLDLNSGRLKRKDKTPSGLRGVVRQYRHFQCCFLGDVLFFQVGKFIEFYQPGDVLVAAELCLKRMAHNRRGARYGFPLAHSGGHLLNLLAKWHSVTLIGKAGAF